MRFPRLNGKVVRGMVVGGQLHGPGLTLIWSHPPIGIGLRVDTGVVSRRDELRAELDGLTWEQREAAIWEDHAVDDERRIELSHWVIAWNMAVFITWVLGLLLPAFSVNPGPLVTAVYFALMPALMWAVKRWLDSDYCEIGESTEFELS